MIIIYNKYFPRAPFLATNVFGVIFCRGKKGRLSAVDINHEYIRCSSVKCCTSALPYGIMPSGCGDGCDAVTG